MPAATSPLRPRARGHDGAKVPGLPALVRRVAAPRPAEGLRRGPGSVQPHPEALTPSCRKRKPRRY